MARLGGILGALAMLLGQFVPAWGQGPWRETRISTGTAAVVVMTPDGRILHIFKLGPFTDLMDENGVVRPVPLPVPPPTQLPAETPRGRATPLPTPTPTPTPTPLPKRCVGPGCGCGCGGTCPRPTPTPVTGGAIPSTLPFADEPAAPAESATRAASFGAGAKAAAPLAPSFGNA